jgi:hypothetical protein
LRTVNDFHYGHRIWHDYLYRCLTQLFDRISSVFELFTEQVKCENRLNTHLNNVEFKNVIEKFKEMTGMQYTRMQFKNKWLKLKVEYSCWKTLLK